MNDGVQDLLLLAAKDYDKSVSDLYSHLEAHIQNKTPCGLPTLALMSVTLRNLCRAHSEMLRHIDEALFTCKTMSEQSEVYVAAIEQKIKELEIK